MRHAGSFNTAKAETVNLQNTPVSQSTRLQLGH
jgi:hypothetical protein